MYFGILAPLDNNILHIIWITADSADSQWWPNIIQRSILFYVRVVHLISVYCHFTFTLSNAFSCIWVTFYASGCFMVMFMHGWRKRRGHWFQWPREETNGSFKWFHHSSVDQQPGVRQGRREACTVHPMQSIGALGHTRAQVQAPAMHGTLAGPLQGISSWFSDLRGARD